MQDRRQLRAGAVGRTGAVADKRNYNCRLCRKVFHSSQCLSRHLTWHSKQQIATGSKCNVAEKAKKLNSSSQSTGLANGLHRATAQTKAGRTGQGDGDAGNMTVSKPRLSNSRGTKIKDEKKPVSTNAAAHSERLGPRKLSNQKELPAESGLKVGLASQANRSSKSELGTCSHCSKSFRHQLVLQRHLQRGCSSAVSRSKAALSDAEKDKKSSPRPTKPVVNSNGLDSVCPELNGIHVAATAKKQMGKAVLKKSMGKEGGRKRPANFCVLCNCSFATKSSLYRHNRRHHPDGSKVDKKSQPTVAKKPLGSFRSRPTKTRVQVSRNSPHSRRNKSKVDEASVSRPEFSDPIAQSEKKVEIDFNEFVKAKAPNNGGEKCLAPFPPDVSKNAVSKKLKSAKPQLPGVESGKLGADKPAAQRKRRECEICHDTFSSTSSLKRHIQRYHAAKKSERTGKLSSLPAAPAPKISRTNSPSNGGHSSSASSSDSPQSVANSPAEFSTGSVTPTECSAPSQPVYLCWTPRPVFKTASIVYRGRQGRRKRKVLLPAATLGRPADSIRRLNSCLAEFSSGSHLAAPVSTGRAVPASAALSFLPATDLSRNPFELPWERKLLPQDASPCCSALTRRPGDPELSPHACRLMGRRFTAAGESVLVVWD